MKQFKTIFGFELSHFFRDKVFVGVTIFLMVLIAAVMFFPRFSGLLGFGSGSDKKDVMLVSADQAESTEQVRQVFAEAFPNYEVTAATGDLAGIRGQITSGEADCAFVLHSLTSYTYYVGNLSMYDSNTAAADTVLQNLYRLQAMTGSGMSAEQASQILSAQVSHETENLGKDQMQNFFYTYILIFALYMVILLYGQMVATSVASEKSSRAMELLITSARPDAMMFGKVIAACLAGLVQLVCVFGSAFLFYRLNRSYWESNQIIRSIFDIPAELLAYMCLFFVLGFFLYAFMFGAVGSTVTKMEDISTAVMPVTLLFVAGFMVVMFSLGSGDVDNTAMKVCSFIPFTSPMAMFTRIAMSTVPAWEILLSVAVLAASVFGVGVLSARIYRVGVLLYGTSPKIGTVIRSILKA